MITSFCCECTISRHANIDQIKIGRTYVSILLNLVAPRGKIWKFVTPDCRKMHFGALEQLKMTLKNSSKTTDIFDKSRDVVLKLHKNRKQT